ncbi:hypothetical protein KIW84_062634 [Lathyrus oleraceus]|uniref:Uncharacterized protein n=1 Tax=Pisum sativum TaxID=3888 RepID=A0A9D4W8X8_PEA|nr:hypothetical protein KIW84_062634 [Pisum sativum]
MDVIKVKTLLVHVHLKVFKVSILKQDHEKCFICLRNSIGCFDVQKDIQMLISNGVLQVSGKKKNDEVSVIVSVFKKPKAFEIFCPCREGTPSVISAKRLDIKMSAPFPYKSDKAVPWGYEPTTTMNGVEKPLVNNKVVTNIADTSGPTRSGRVFAHVNLRSEVVASGKASGWGRIVQLSDNKNRNGLGFNPCDQSAKEHRIIQEVKLIYEKFRSGGFMN